MKKYKKVDINYELQNNQRWARPTEVLFIKLKKILKIVLILILLGGLVNLFMPSEKVELTKEQIDTKISERYEEIYSERFEEEQIPIEAEEITSMKERVQIRLEDLKAGYWKEAKEETLGGVKEYIEASPEVISFIIDFDKLESQKYASIDDFLEKNYPNSRLIGHNIKARCKKNEMSENQCLLTLGIAGKESAFDEAYVKNDWSPAVMEGKARNNMFGLKANRRYIDTKCGEDKECRAKYSSIPYDGFAFVPFNTFESGLDWFMNDTLKKGYPSVTNPYQMITFYNNNPKWADDVQHFMNILKPLLNY